MRAYTRRAAAVSESMACASLAAFRKRVTNALRIVAALYGRSDAAYCPIATLDSASAVYTASLRSGTCTAA